MEKTQEPLFTSKVIGVLIAGFAICAFLFYEMMKFADAGNLILVILTSIAISIVAIVILKFIKHQQIKRI
ncbi:MAG: hypothetical protein A4E24_00790 [Methanomethylovorans sp. PtaU1.Bin093]|jgi:uncharacterized membrane protein|uniref:hypothetical protein n=1 Tax=Methanomethylovorans sp. PtaU1.Bin093 TaxID=1811679 RepID=UPI0009D2F0B4|nr:hypothetical protein [Methanomethylovorans sp. PtaU1.Bin093]OPY21063.1 MAG: hypothetical protein A4E24_00790 [Methanomethylovorans sp. PtaU1.Bin093]